MRRVVVVGCGGAGKSVLAARLGQILDLQVTHLDAVHYDADWNALPPAEFAERQRDIVDGASWVVDGNYAATLPVRLARADTVIFLDLPARVCLAGIARRRLRPRGERHRITWTFLRYVVTYRRKMRPRVDRLIEEHASHARRLRFTSRREVATFLEHARRGRSAQR